MHVRNGEFRVGDQSSNQTHGKMGAQKETHNEIDAINRGDAIVDRGLGTAWINGRLWGYHTDTGTVYPIEGEGFVQMNAIQYYALRTIARYNGINPDSERELAYHPELTDEDRELARRVWRMREDAED